jgi:riboflavin transporter FmnP
MNENRKYDLRKIVGMAVFAALAYGVTFVFRIPVSFLTFDAKDAVLTIAAFMYGPLAAIIMALIPAFIELITISGTGIYGFLMNFVSSASFAFVASLIYKYKRTLNGAIIALYISTLATVSLMMVMNILITPLYMGVERSFVISYIPSLLLPFNLAKSLMNSAFTMLLYKPVSLAMKRARLIRGEFDTKFNKSSVIIISIGALTLALSIVIFVLLKKSGV